MKAAYYKANGAAHDVLRVGDIKTPLPAPGEVRVKLAAIVAAHEAVETGTIGNVVVTP